MAFPLTRRVFVQSLLALPGLSRLSRAHIALDPTGAPTLWYTRPAEQWVEALPVGNGRLGGMLFGGVGLEHVQLNEDTLWSGAPKAWDNPQARVVLPDLRRLVAEGRYVEADQLARQALGPYTQSYMPLGDLHVAFDLEKVKSYGQIFEHVLDLA